MKLLLGVLAITVGVFAAPSNSSIESPNSTQLISPSNYTLNYNFNVTCSLSEEMAQRKEEWVVLIQVWQSNASLGSPEFIWTSGFLASYASSITDQVTFTLNEKPKKGDTPFVILLHTCSNPKQWYKDKYISTDPSDTPLNFVMDAVASRETKIREDIISEIMALKYIVFYDDKLPWKKVILKKYIRNYEQKLIEREREYNETIAKFPIDDEKTAFQKIVDFFGIRLF